MNQNQSSSQCTPRNRVAGLMPTPLSDVDALFSHFFAPSAGARTARAAWRAPASVWESEDHLHVELDAPGVAQDGVDVTFDKGELSIELERRGPAGVADAADTPAYAYNERSFGKVTRQLTLPDTVDPASIEARLADGVLRVSVAKRPEAQPRKIDVRRD